MTSFIAWALSLLPTPSPVFVPTPTPQGMAWCGSCERHTARDALPGTSFGGKSIPTWFFCVFCGIADWDYLPEEEVA